MIEVSAFTSPLPLREGARGREAFERGRGSGTLPLPQMLLASLEPLAPYGARLGARPSFGPRKGRGK
jgi:hypothetical protein